MNTLNNIFEYCNFKHEKESRMRRLLLLPHHFKINQGEHLALAVIPFVLNFLQTTSHPIDPYFYGAIELKILTIFKLKYLFKNSIVPQLFSRYEK